jgi:hypothetical protein
MAWQNKTHISLQSPVSVDELRCFYDDAIGKIQKCEIIECVVDLDVEQIIHDYSSLLLCCKLFLGVKDLPSDTRNDLSHIRRDLLHSTARRCKLLLEVLFHSNNHECARNKDEISDVKISVTHQAGLYSWSLFDNMAPIFNLNKEDLAHEEDLLLQMAYTTMPDENAQATTTKNHVAQGGEDFPFSKPTLKSQGWIRIQEDICKEWPEHFG